MYHEDVTSARKNGDISNRRLKLDELEVADHFRIYRLIKWWDKMNDRRVGH